MSLGAVVDAAIAALAAELGSGVAVTDALPVAAGDIPAAVVSVSEAERPQIGIGGTPSGPQTGALEVTTTVDLADPRLTFGDETVDLLDPGRTVLVVPNGPLVTAAGSEGPPFAAGDASFADAGGPYALVDTAPSGRQVQLDPDAGTATFGTPLPAAGDLDVMFHVGLWEVSVIRYSGLLHVDLVTTTGAPAADLARQTGDALVALEASGDTFQVLVPTAWGSADPDERIPTGHLLRRLSHRFVFELRTPVVPTGGGVIRRVEVISHNDDAEERFDIPTTPAP